MLDTVRLYTPEYSLSRVHSLETPARITATGEVREVGGPKAVMEDGWGCHVEKFRGCDMLFFDGSVPRLVHGTSLRECGEDDCAVAERKILDRLRRVGVSLPSGAFDDSVIVSRADFCRNLPVSGAVSEYLAALGKYRLPRTDLAAWNSETLLWSNTRRQFTFYDKIADTLAKEQSMEVLRLARSMKNNLLRVEYRALRAPVVREIVGGKSVRFGQLFDRSVSRGILLRTMDRLVRREEQHPVEGYANLSEMIEQAKKRRRYSFPYVVQAIGARSIMEMFGHDSDRLLRFLLQHYPRSSAHRYRNFLCDVCAAFVERREAELVEEVRGKLAA